MTGSDQFSRARRKRLACALVLAAPMLAHCDRQRQTPEPEPEAEATAAPAAPAAPLGPLTRGDLLQAMDQAASAFAAGGSRSSSDPLVGRAFEILSPFGCGGLQAAGVQPAPATEGLAQAQWGPEGRTIVLSLTPADWSASTLLSTGAAGSNWEAAEGLWVPRPWLRTGGCPSVARDPLQTAPSPPSPQTVGLAAVFETGSSRLGRRDGRAYRHVIRGEGDAPPAPSASGYRLKLAGRVVGFPNGQAIRCSAQGVDQRPVCVAAVQLDEVAFEAAEGAVLSRWTSG